MALLKNAQQIPKCQHTFVCCIEAGFMEQQVLWLVESLRLWGGTFADAQVIAVKPRFGPSVSSKTKKALSKLAVTYADIDLYPQYSWYNSFNKAKALIAAEKIVKTEFIVCCDTDTIIIKEPSNLFLSGNVDFAARPASKILGTSGPGDPNEPYWQEVCKVFRININLLPWIISCPEGENMRSYWQSGVFVYRKTSNLSKYYMDCWTKSFHTHIASHRCGIFFYDQRSLTLAVHLAGLKFKTLDHSYNYTFNKRLPQLQSKKELSLAKIVHYYDSLWPDYCNHFMGYLKDIRPDVYEWLKSKVPLQNNLPLHWRILHKALRTWRGYTYKAFERKCLFY